MFAHACFINCLYLYKWRANINIHTVAQLSYCLLCEMSENMQVTHTICLNGNNLTRQENAIHNPSVTGTYHSTLDASMLKNEIFMMGNEYQRKLESASEIKKMYKCQDCPFSTNWISNLRRHENGYAQNIGYRKNRI